MKDPFFFGYGSLVNRATHDYPDAYPARLSGWRRVWRHTALREVAFLSVEPAYGVVLEGLIAKVPGADWANLDEREWAYDRLNANEQVFHDAPIKADVHVYSIHRRHGTDARFSIRLSYLDTVVQGYLREFGTRGAEAFFETTAGWDAPVMDDRASPIYARHQPLTASERDFVDASLRNLSAQVGE